MPEVVVQNGSNSNNNNLCKEMETNELLVMVTSDLNVPLQIVKTKLFCSCRLIVALIAFLGFVNLYALRINISVALVCMLNQTAIDLDITTGNKTLNSDTATKDAYNTMCSKHLMFANGTQIKKSDGEFNWNKDTQGLVLGSFFWGYIFTQIPGGWLSSRFGGKTVFGWCMLVCALVTLLMPVAAKLHYSVLLVLRFIAGLCQGVSFPAMHSVWSQWSPPLERSTLLGFTFAGTQIGNVVALPISGAFCELQGGWIWIFYFFGIVGVLWFLGWHFFVSNSPADHKTISVNERLYIQSSLKGQVSNKGTTYIPWKKFATSRPVWGIIIANTCTMFGIYLFLTSMPTYMKEVLKFDMKTIGLLSALPYLIFFACVNITAHVADRFRSKNILSTTTTRKLFNTIGNIVPAAFILWLGFTDCTCQLLAIVLLVIGLSFTGCVYGSGWVINHADIAPRYAGILFGISNTFGTIPGFIGPWVVATLTKNQTAQEWRNVFIVASAVFTVGAIAYLILGSGELQPWANLTDSEPKLKMKHQDTTDETTHLEMTSDTTA